VTGTLTRRALSTAALLLVLTTSACSLRPEDLPSVRGGLGASYAITIEFESAMNLPSGADVILDGIRVGEVRDIDVEAGSVAVKAAVAEDTRIPSDIRAIVRQNTLLGDTYVALVREPDSRVTGFLDEGGTVPLARTTSPPQLEDTMAVLATFVNGGSIQRVQDVMAEVNTVMPTVPEIRNLAAVVSTDLRDLAGRTTEIDRLLAGMNTTAESVNANGGSLATLFDASTVHYWRRLATSVVSHIGQILPSVGSLYNGGLWLVPMFESLADTTDISLSDTSAAAQLSEMLRTTVIPFANHPEVDIVGVESASGATLADTENVLRVLGAVR
jgi:phospholipid/cholesterol/gamma-HCH transport system substrate-binding protein